MSSSKRPFHIPALTWSPLEVLGSSALNLATCHCSSGNIHSKRLFHICWHFTCSPTEVLHSSASMLATPNSSSSSSGPAPGSIHSQLQTTCQNPLQLTVMLRHNAAMCTANSTSVVHVLPAASIGRLQTLGPCSIRTPSTKFVLERHGAAKKGRLALLACTQWMYMQDTSHQDIYIISSAAV